MRCFTDMLGKQVTALIALESLALRTIFLARVSDTGLSLKACRRADNGAK